MLLYLLKNKKPENIYSDIIIIKKTPKETTKAEFIIFVRNPMYKSIAFV